MGHLAREADTDLLRDSRSHWEHVARPTTGRLFVYAKEHSDTNPSQQRNKPNKESLSHLLVSGQEISFERSNRHNQVERYERQDSNGD